MRLEDEKLLRMLADDYVLGGLKGKARVRFERMVDCDTRVAGFVWDSENILSGLMEDVPAVEPPEHLWRSIDQRINGRYKKRISAQSQSRRVSRSAFAIAASILLILIIGFTLHRYSTSSPMRVLLDNHDKLPVAQITVASNLHSVELVIPKGINVPPQKALQLWLLPQQGAPISLAVMKDAKQGRYRIVIPHPIKASSIKGFAFSIEPPNGSPQPTGPILYSGYVNAS